MHNVNMTSLYVASDKFLQKLASLLSFVHEKMDTEYRSSQPEILNIINIHHKRNKDGESHKRKSNEECELVPLAKKTRCI